MVAESTSNTYNSAGQLTQTVSGGETTSYSYDGAGKKNVVSQEELSGAAVAESTTNTYNQAGQLTQTVSGGETTSYTYDGGGNMVSQEELSAGVVAESTSEHVQLGRAN